MIQTSESSSPVRNGKTTEIRNHCPDRMEASDQIRLEAQIRKILWDVFTDDSA